MQAPTAILQVWNQFKHFPMETLTKVWYAQQKPKTYQRTVAQMKEHYEKYNITGNCFDLAIWLLEELHEQQIEAYAIGHDLFTEEAHVAVIAIDRNNYKYLCDLGDQWIQPICVDSNNPAFHTNDCAGFFPGATVQVLPQGDEVEILYKRPNGKVSKQQFQLTPIDAQQLLQAAEFSQKLIKPAPLLECRQYGDEVVHWEFYNFNSFSSSMKGLIKDEQLPTITDWVTKINEKTGYDEKILLQVLTYYTQSQKVNS